MPAKRFNSLMLTEQYSTILIGKSNHDTTVNVVFVNQSEIPVFVSLIYVNGNSMVKFTPSDFLLCDAEIPPKEKLEVRGIVVEENTMLSAKTKFDNKQISVIAYGYEERF